MRVSSTVPQERLRLALTISGAVSLGSFESGVIRELACAARAADGPFMIDVISGASAGAITAAQAAKAMTSAEPSFKMFDIWTTVGLDDLTHGYLPKETSPFSRTWIRETLRDCLMGSAERDAELPSSYRAGVPEPVHLLFSLTELQGCVTSLDKRVDGIGVPLATTLHNVISSLKIEGEGSIDLWNRIQQLVLASAAHSAVWDAMRLRAPAEENPLGEEWLPKRLADDIRRREAESGEQLYVDGGTVNNLPIGAAVRKVSKLTQRPYDPYRVVLYVDPAPVQPNDASPVPDPDWAHVAWRALGLLEGKSEQLTDLKWIGESNKAVTELLESLVAICRSSWEEEPARSHGLVSASTQEEFAHPSPQPPGPLPTPLTWEQVEMIMQGACLDRGPAEAQELADALIPFYEWLDRFGPDRQAPVGEVMERLAAHLNDAPTGETPRFGAEDVRDAGRLARPDRSGLLLNTTRKIRRAILDVATYYYQARQDEDRLGQMVSWHLDLLQHAAARGRQWVLVHRIVPSEQPPKSAALGHFAGFLYRPWMQFDYILGRRAAMLWMLENFPHNAYVRSLQLPRLPDCPEVSMVTALQDNASAIVCAGQRASKQVEQMLHLQWLGHASVHVFRWLFTSALCIGPMLGLQHLHIPGLSTLVSTWKGLAASSGVVGLAIHWWRQQPTWRRLALLLWAGNAAYQVKRLWGELFRLTRPKGKTAIAPSSAAGAQSADQQPPN